MCVYVCVCVHACGMFFENVVNKCLGVVGFVKWYVCEVYVVCASCIRCNSMVCMMVDVCCMVHVCTMVDVCCMVHVCTMVDVCCMVHVCMMGGRVLYENENL